MTERWLWCVMWRCWSFDVLRFYDGGAIYAIGPLRIQRLAYDE